MKNLRITFIGICLTIQINAQLSLTFKDGKTLNFEGKYLTSWTYYAANQPKTPEYELKLYVERKDSSMNFVVYKEKINSKELIKWEDVWTYSVRKDQPLYEPSVTQFTDDSTKISYYTLSFFTEESTAFEYDIYLNSSSKPMHQKFTAISFQSNTEAPLLELATFFKF